MQVWKDGITAHGDNANFQDGFAAGKRMGRPIKLMKMFHKLLRAFQQKLSFFGNNYIVVVAFKQGYPAFFLQFPHRFGDAGLRNV